MEYAIGIDSGGTNYRLRAVSSSGETLSQYVGQPANHYHLGMDMFPKVVNDNISSLEETGIPAVPSIVELPAWTVLRMGSS